MPGNVRRATMRSTLASVELLTHGYGEVSTTQRSRVLMFSEIFEEFFVSCTFPPTWRNQYIFLLAQLANLIEINNAMMLGANIHDMTMDGGNKSTGLFRK